MTGYALGIDVGTTFTAAATYRDGRASTVPLAESGHGGHTVPSALFLREDGVLLIGDQAVRRGITEPSRVAREFKRRFGDAEPLRLGDVPVSTAQLTGHLIGYVVRRATEQAGAPPAHVTLTHPAAWGPFVRERMAEAAAAAELSDIGLLVEPVAAAVHYAAGAALAPGALVAVYDFGGGTFDATVVRKVPGGFEVVHTEGLDDVGGTDLDDIVMRHVATSLDLRWSDYPVDDGPVRAALAQVRANAVAAKEALSGDVEASIPVLLPDLRRDVRITRGEFETAIRIPVLRTIGALEQCVAGAGIELTDLHSVLLVGGSSRVPLVSRLIASELGVPVAVDAHPKYAVCQGAAISAGSRLPAGRPVWPEEWAPTPPAPSTPPSSAAPTAPSTPSLPTAPTAPPLSTAPAVPSAPALSAAATVPMLSPAPDDDGAELIVPVATRVDPVRADVGGILDDVVRAAPPADRPKWPVLADDVPLAVTHTGVPGQTRRVVLMAAAIVVVLLAAAGATLMFGDTSNPPSVPPTAGPTTLTGSTGPAAPVAPLAVLTEQQVPGRPGELMAAVTAAGTVLHAVGGSSADGTPRAWRYANGTWTAGAAPTLPAGTDGAFTGIAAGPGGRLVAVGWTAPHVTQPASADPAAFPPGPPPAERRAAIWTSTDGRDWRAAGGLPGNLGELTDVVARPGGFLAVGTDWTADRASGDGAVLTSADGTTWQRVTARGLDGPGPCTLRRLVPGGAGDLVAIGSRLEGGVSRPVVWTSPDGTGWTVAATLDSPGAAVAAGWALTRTAGGLVAGGYASTVDGSRTPVLWAGPQPASLRPFRVDGQGAVYGLAGAVAVGARPGPGGWTPAAWTLQLPTT
ncbi:Hsp70 family protein [Dactylosporangium sp. NPDC049525]|uniref:Hsp70 family protein n=1 Tax=Dactylosporangium sp. NPDC049525 TaxID=3154730 RepID=UPI003417CF27